MSVTPQGIITKVSGPLVVAKGMSQVKMYEVVRVSNQKLIGEVIELKNDTASIQVYEETTGIGPGEPVFLTGNPLSLELGPGLLSSIYDGIQRPLDQLASQAGAFLERGIEAKGLDHTKKWSFTPQQKNGAEVTPGDVLGVVPETALIEHRIMVPPTLKSGTIKSIVPAGEYTIDQVIAEIETETETIEVKMYQVWPIRNPRPVNRKLTPSEPLITGIRIVDTFFPIVKGGTASVPGPFGAGKTVIQQSLAKWSDAEVIVYVGCGERGNEMTDVLKEFPELKDPKTGESLMKRTILIANTSNMPVAAREASVYTGITIAEYYRDMGYSVALMADSTSRWAEAMREMSGRLEEMPGEEGYPAYLGSKMAAFYERAGLVNCLGQTDRQGSLTVIGAVSPPGGDLSEPVTQNTLRITKVFWSLDASLAYKRHYPSIHWLNSYSLYSATVSPYMNKKVAPNWLEVRQTALEILQTESKLSEIVRLVGVDALSTKEQLILETAKSIREDFLQQNAFDEIDAYTSLQKMFFILEVIVKRHQLAISKSSQDPELTVADLFDQETTDKIAQAKLTLEQAKDTIKDII